MVSSVVKWKLLLELGTAEGDLLANDFRLVATGLDQKVWSLSSFDNPNFIYLLLVQNGYWIAQLESKTDL